ncbi:MAG: 50S ribosomal protein L35 [Phycisphaerae bacterium]|nr:50S ribosomal protein L35 [Phycisphaerae bacterium]
MSKMKTHKGMRKRVKVTASGKVKYRKSFKGHLMSAKSGDRRRRLNKPAIMSNTITRRVLRALGEE